MATGGSDEPDDQSFNLQLPSDDTVDFYSLLQVGRNATAADIKVAYRQLSLKYHPDKTLDIGTEDIMKRLNKAKTILLDEVKRAEYDDKLDGQGANCDPKGFLPTGIRFSDLFLKDFNQLKADFKSGKIKVLGHRFEQTLQSKVHSQVLRNIPRQDTTPVKLSVKLSQLESIFQASNDHLEDPIFIKRVYQLHQKLLTIQKRRPFLSIFSKSKATDTIINLDVLDADEIQLLAILFTNSSQSSKEHLRSILPMKGSGNPKEQWMETCFQFLSDGSIGATKAAMACLIMALLNTEDKVKPVLDVAQRLLDNGLPELALPLVSAALKECQVAKYTLQGYIIAATALKKLAEDEKDWEWDEKLEAFQAAEDSCSLAEKSLGKSIEMPKLVAISKSTHQALQDLKSLNNGLFLKIMALWSIRNYNELLTFITTKLFSNNNTIKEKIIEATQDFLQLNIAFVDKMSSDDQSTLLLLRGLIKIEQGDNFSGFIDIERAAWSSSQVIFRIIMDVVIHISFANQNASLFSMNFFSDVCASESLLGIHVDLSNWDRCLKLFFPQVDELQFPFSARWPELEVVGLNVRGHRKFENAVSSQVKEGTWNEWEAALGYIDYIVACNHKAELTLCILYASLWLYKYIKANPSLADNIKFALTETVVLCLQVAQNFVQRLAPPMRLYVSRLSLGILLHTLQLTKKVARNEAMELVIQLIRNVMYTCRFCPLWDMPIVPISEAALLNLKVNRFHTEFLLRLQDINPIQRPISEADLRYQLYENDLCRVYPLEDSESAKARAMEELLKEKGWSWNNVQDLMTSPLSPRDSEGWLIRSRTLGTKMEFAQIKGFKLNLNPDNPSIEVLVVPASRGVPGLFTHEDIHTVIDLHQEGREGLFFSLDPPSEMEHYHPFQQFRYAPDKIQNTSLLHTMFETDYLMKSFSVGTEVSSKPPFKQRSCRDGLLKGLPPSLVEALKPVGDRPGGHQGSVHRFWIEADEFTYNEDSNGSQLTFRLSEVKMTVRNHPLIIGPDGKLVDTKHEDSPDSAESRFAADMTEAYDELSLHFPMFGRLRELAKLQFLGIILACLLKGANEKAHNPKVPDELLRSIQSDAQKEHRSNVERILSNVKRQIGTWPSADDHSKVSSVVDRVYRDTLSKNNIPSYSVDYRTERDLKNKIFVTVKERFREEDNKLPSTIADALYDGLCKGRIPKRTLESNVRDWLHEANSHSLSSAAKTRLVDRICSVYDPPSRKDIEEMMREYHLKRYNTIDNLIRGLKSSPKRHDSSACNWVPAAVHIEETDHTFSLCYGGVTLNPSVKEGYVLPLPRNVKSVRVQAASSSGSRVPRRSFHTSQTYRAPNVTATRQGSGSTGGQGGSGSTGGAGGHTGTGAGGSQGAAAGGASGGRGGGGGDGRGDYSDDEDADEAEKEEEGSGGVKGKIKDIDKLGRNGVKASIPHQGGASGNNDKSSNNQSGPRIFQAAALAIGVICGITENKQVNESEKLNKSHFTVPPNPKFEKYFCQLETITPCGGGAEIPIKLDHTPVTKDTTCVIYCIYCAKTGKKYVGMTEQTLEQRMKRHLYRIRYRDYRFLPARHFNSKASEATLDDFRVTVLKTFKPGTSTVELRKVETDIMENQLFTLHWQEKGGMNIKRSYANKSKKK